MEKLSKLFFVLPLCLFASACGNNSAKTSDIVAKNDLKALAEKPVTYEPPSVIKDTLEEIKTTIDDAPDKASQQVVDSTPIKVATPEKQVVKATKPKKKKTKPKPKKYPLIVFDEYEYDFGEIEQGESVKHNFVFKNTGEAPLSISKATATCGCTQPSFPFIDIMPDEEGYIGVSYFSVGKEGVQEPEISVFTNDKKNHVVTLKLKGFVHLPEEKKDTLKDTSGIDSPY